MILRAGSGWQTVTADLALILFLVTAQANRDTGPAAQQLVPVAAALVESGGAGLAVYRPGPETDLGQWLETTLTDDRQGVTVIIRYPEGDREDAFRTGSELLEEIEAHGTTARLVLERSARSVTLVMVGYEGEPDAGTILAEGR